MKKNLLTPLVLIVINELCGSDATKPKNTGTSGAECLEGVLERQFFAREGFAFTSVEDFKTKASWLTAIANKDIVPMFTAYVVANANTDATLYTAGNFTFETAPAVKVTTYENYLGFCSHSALASYPNSEYTQVFELNSDGSFVGVGTDDGKVKGQDVKLSVGIRQRAVADKPATTLVTTTYLDYRELDNNAVVVKPTFGRDLKGIFDVQLEQVTATATQITFKAIVECGKRALTSLTSSDVILKDDEGVTQTVSFVAADADGIYTITGTGFATGYTLEIDGVVTQGDLMYEGESVITITLD